MKKFMVIARVHDTEYLTVVEAETAYEAEHIILDHGICGKHTYSVLFCMAYDVEAMKYDTFRYSAIESVPIALIDLFVIIENRNEEIERMDYAEERVKTLTKLLEDTQKQLEDAKRLFESLS